jgi:hypothetical protein
MALLLKVVKSQENYKIKQRNKGKHEKLIKEITKRKECKNLYYTYI